MHQLKLDAHLHMYEMGSVHRFHQFLKGVHNLQYRNFCFRWWSLNCFGCVQKRLFLYYMLYLVFKYICATLLKYCTDYKIYVKQRN